MTEDTPSARATWCEWARACVLSANIAWTMLCLGGADPRSRVVTAALTAVLVALHFADPRCGTRAHAAGCLFLPFIAYAAMNAAWVTPVGWLGWTDWLNWAQAAAVFWVVLNGVRSTRCRMLLAGALVATGAVSGALGLYQHFVRPDWIMLGRTQAQQYIGRSSGSFGNPNNLGALMVLLIPPVGLLAFARGRPVLRLVCGLALAALLSGFILAISRGAWIALAAAFALRPLFARGHLGRRLAAAGAAVAGAIASGAALCYLMPSMRERVMQLVANAGEASRPILWRAALSIFREHPLLGGGAGSFDSLFEHYRPESFQSQPYFAHCDYLNTLCDYGALGFLLCFCAAGFIGWRCARTSGLAGAAFTGLLAFALHLFVDFHMKLPAIAMAVAAVFAMVTQEAWPAADAPGGGRRRLPAALSLLGAAAALLLAYEWVIPKYRAEAIRSAARERIDRMARAGTDNSTQGGLLNAACADFSRAVALDPSNAQAWSDRAYAESLLALVTPAKTVQLGGDVVRDAGRATALCPIIAEFWIRRGTGLDMQYRWLEGGDCFARALGLAPARADVWYYQAYHLSLSPRELEPAMAALDVCLRLDPGFLLAQSLRQQLAIRLQKRS